MPTALEYRLLQVARKQARLDEESYRMVLRNVAGVASAKQLDQVGLEDVMATLEDAGFRHAGKPEDYWRMRVMMRGSYCGTRLIHKIVTLASQQKYELAGLCRRFSGDRAAWVDKLTPAEGSRLVEAIKAIIARGDKPEILAAEAAGGSPEPRVEAGTASETVPEPKSV